MKLTFKPLLLFLSLLSAYISPQDKVKFVPDNARLEKIFSDGFSTEGPAEAHDGSILFSDQTFTAESNMQAGYIWRFDPKTGRSSIFRSPSGMANGIKFYSNGDLIVAQGADFGGRCIVRTNLNTGKSWIIAGLFNGKSYNSPNDLAIDNKGRIYFTDPRYVGHEPLEQPVMGVYRIDTDGKAALIISDIGRPNGIAVSPDQKTLYVGCFDEGEEGDLNGPGLRPEKMAVMAYDLTPEGTVSFRKTLIEYDSNTGPDGITVDMDGNLYVAVRSETRPGICIYTPEGKEISYIATPEIPSNLTFSKRAEKSYLYITAGRSLYRIEVLAKGYFFHSDIKGKND